MKSKLKYLVVPMLLCAGQALAGDFCDEPRPPGSEQSGGGFEGSACEINVIRASVGFAPRDLSFDEALYQRLQNVHPEQNPYGLSFDLIVSALKLNAGAGVEMGISEWLFAPPDKSASERLLSFSLTREGDQLTLLLDWWQPPHTNWSQFGGGGGEPILLGHERIALGAIGKASYRLTLVREGDQILVYPSDSSTHSKRPVGFKLPSERWTPMRLRSGLLRGVNLKPQDGFRLSWPTEFIEPKGDGGGGDSIGLPWHPSS
ncbi:hypothetical protein [Pseudomonas sp. CGJS7]|uniref:hypothetical protein n=1 Tax=Pseudomonas sp. CGJS7 TaxID=3109348 RepID=UPI00300901B5